MRTFGRKGLQCHVVCTFNILPTLSQKESKTAGETRIKDFNARQAQNSGRIAYSRTSRDHFSRLFTSEPLELLAFQLYRLQQ